jgi:hypothetical protein
LPQGLLEKIEFQLLLAEPTLELRHTLGASNIARVPGGSTRRFGRPGRRS